MDKECSVAGCDATYKDHKWGHMKAAREGWFFSKEGQAFCSTHIPEWVESWRAKQKEKNEV